MDKTKTKSVIKRAEPPKNFRNSNEVSAAYKQVGQTPNRNTKSWYRDIYEFYQNNEIDFGEITSQYLSLELNPYPRSDIEIETIDGEGTSEKPNPFDVLTTLKGQK